MIQLLVSLLIVALACTSCAGLKLVPVTEEQCDCIQGRIRYDLDLNPAYLWGGASLDPGAPKDCSGAIYSYFAACGVPVLRVTAAWMGAGEGGWLFPLVSFEDAKRLALIIMTTQRKRPDGHVGILVMDVKLGMVTKMAHASSRWGFVATIVENARNDYWYPKITKIRQVRWR